jgi:hypothetical protein
MGEAPVGAHLHCMRLTASQSMARAQLQRSKLWFPVMQAFELPKFPCKNEPQYNTSTRYADTGRS